MRTTRRQFIQTTVTTSVALQTSRRGQGMARPFPVNSGSNEEEVNNLISREGKVNGLTKQDLPTPALLVDLDIFESNLQKMVDHAKSKGKNLRPHAKTHKCPQVARRLIEAGTLGICVATVREAEVMVKSGIHGVHLTSPITDPKKVERMVKLAGQSTDVMAAVDHVYQVDLYQETAQTQGFSVNLLVDLNVGDRRTGAEPGEMAVKVGRRISESANLKLKGVQAYSGGSSHVNGFDARKAHSLERMNQATRTFQMLKDEGLPSDILSGGSTGTYNIDTELPELTELQAGSFIFMDLDYRNIGSKKGAVYDDFGHSLTVLATVVSANHQDRVTVDAGLKAFATDRDFGPEPKDIEGVSYRWGGDEFGILTLESPRQKINLGDKLELIIPHCDPSVNLYDRIYACRKDKVEEIWSVMERLPS